MRGEKRGKGLYIYIYSSIVPFLKGTREWKKKIRREERRREKIKKRESAAAPDPAERKSGI